MLLDLLGLFTQDLNSPGGTFGFLVRCPNQIYSCCVWFWISGRCFPCVIPTPHTVQDVPVNRLCLAVQQRARSSPHIMNDIKSVHLVSEATRHPSSEPTHLSVQSLSAGAADRNKSVT